MGAMVYSKRLSTPHLQSSNKQTDEAEREHEKNRNAGLVSLSIPLSKAPQKRKHAVTRQRLQHARASNERTQRRRESHDEDAHHCDVRREPHVLEDVRVRHQRVVREHERRERVEQRVVRQRRADRDDRAATQIAAGVLEIAGEIGALHDAGHGGEDHGEHRAQRGGRQRRRNEILFEGGQRKPGEQAAMGEFLRRSRGEEKRT